MIVFYSIGLSVFFVFSIILISIKCCYLDDYTTRIRLNWLIIIGLVSLQMFNVSLNVSNNILFVYCVIQIAINMFENTLLIIKQAENKNKDTNQKEETED